MGEHFSGLTRRPITASRARYGSAATDVELLRLTELALMNAPFDDGGWARAITMVATATGSASANLVAIGGPLLLPLNMFVGRDAELTAGCFDRPELWGKCNWRVQSAGAPMSVQYEAHYAACRAAGGTEEYDDIVSDLDVPYGCQSALISDERTFLGLAVLRGRREGPSDEICRARFRHLLFHVQRAIRVQLALDGEAAELTMGQMASLSCRLILLDRHGCLSALTASAEALLEDGGPARLSGLSFRLSDAGEDYHLQAAMARLLREREDCRGPQVHEMRAGRSPEFPKGRWRVTLIRLPQRPDGLGFEAQLAVSFRPAKT